MQLARRRAARRRPPAGKYAHLDPAPVPGLSLLTPPSDSAQSRGFALWAMFGGSRESSAPLKDDWCSSQSRGR